ncbi:MAG: MBL fold metallo-hydrolase, partial [Flavobacteriaceae bacterium]|nr:MBL fold metallo-hydrolase [Flavobacteriaceae bacterium]
FDVLFVDGHTEKQMIPYVRYKGKTLVFMADLCPTVGHIPVPYVTGYDTRPLLSMDEKTVFMEQAADENLYLFLEHDAHNEICTVKRTEKGIRLNEIHTFEEFINI